MKKWEKAVMIFSGGLIAAGAVCTAAGAVMGGSLLFGIDLKNGYIDYSQGAEERTIEGLNSFQDVVIDVDSVNLTILPTDEPEPYLVEKKGQGQDWLNCASDGDTLRVEETDSNAVLGIRLISTDFRSDSAGESSLTLYLPQNKELSSFSVKDGYGDVSVSGVNCQTYQIKAESGDVQLSNISCGELTLEAEYGDASLQDCEAETMDIKLESGKLTAKSAEADSITLKAEYGDVSWAQGRVGQGTFQLEDGDVEISGVQISELLQVENDYGDIFFATINGPEAYSYELSTEYGQVSVSGKKLGGSVIRDKDDAPAIRLSCENGDVILE